MASPMIVTQDTGVAQAAIGMNTGKVLSFGFNDTSYSLPDPNEGLIATLFPSDETWHPLYDHDYKEIAGHLFSIEGIPNATPEQKHMLVGKVQSIVVESYHHGAMAHVYWCIILLAICLFAQYYYKVDSFILSLMTYGFAIGAAGYWLYATTWARGAGTNYWTTFMSDLTSRLNVGTLPSKILQDYGADAEREKDRAALARAAPASTGSGSFLGAALGALAGTMIRR